LWGGMEQGMKFSKQSKIEKKKTRGLWRQSKKTDRTWGRGEKRTGGGEHLKECEQKGAHKLARRKEGGWEKGSKSKKLERKALDNEKKQARRKAEAEGRKNQKTTTTLGPAIATGNNRNQNSGKRGKMSGKDTLYSPSKRPEDGGRVDLLAKLEAKVPPQSGGTHPHQWGGGKGSHGDKD